MEKIKVALIGAGMRGTVAYAAQALKSFPVIEVVAVAEPDAARRQAFQAQHSLPDNMCFETGTEMLEKPQFADAVFVCSQDRQHYADTMAALKKGYHVLVEKPMSDSPRECAEMVKCAEETGRVLTVCHVLRYTPFYNTLKNLLDAGAVGEIVAVEHSENVAWWHYAHSYVRGNWRNEAQASPMILAKSCHDLDLLVWLVGRNCRKISSFGCLKHFRKENAPPGAPARCTEGCPHAESCAYYAPRMYANTEGDWQRAWVRQVVSADPGAAALQKALEEGPYGCCVYHCDNDVVDHQVVNMEFDDEIEVSFIMTAFTMENRRTTRVMGTKAELWADIEANRIEYRDFLTNTKRVIQLDQSDEGHNGGDAALVGRFAAAVCGRREAVGEARVSLQSHLMAFAAEKARKEGVVVNLDDYEKELLK